MIGDVLAGVSQIGAFLWKDVQQHALAFVGFFVVLLVSMGMFLSFGLQAQTSSLIEVAANTAWVTAPALSFFVLRRLIDLEYSEPTYEFLAALPGGVLQRTVLKYVLGLVFVLGCHVFLIGLVALLAHRQEILRPLYGLQVAAQILTYTWASFGVVFLGAHLGRFRAVYYLLLLIFLLDIEKQLPGTYANVLWHAPISEPLDATRSAVPWYGLALATTWALGTSLFTLALVPIGRGAWIPALYRRARARERAAMVVMVLFGLLSFEFLDAIDLDTPSFEGVPAVGVPGRTDVRVLAAPGAPLHAHAERLHDHLEDVADALGVGAWPRVVLAPRARGEDELGVVTVRSRDAGELLLEVDPRADADRIQWEALTHILDAHTGGQVAARPQAAWVLAGAPRWFVPPRIHRDVDPYALRAAVAGARLSPTDTLDDTLALQHAWGPDVTAGAAFVALQVLAEAEGRPAVDALLRDLLGPGRAAQPVPTLLGRLAARQGALDQDLHHRWRAALLAHQARHAVDLHALDRILDDTIEEIDPHASQRTLVVNAAPGTDLRLSWTALEPLHAGPLPRADWTFRAVHQRGAILRTSLGRQDHYAARLVRPEPRIAGDLVTALVIR